MLKTLSFCACLCALIACSDSNNDNDATGGTGGSVFQTGGTGGMAGAAGSGGTGGVAVTGGTGGVAATGGTGGTDVLTGGGQLSYCEGDMDCDDGLECYGTGNYCSATCMEDADCTSLGDNYGCGGLMGGGGFGDDGGVAPMGVCRASCTGTDDTTTCPTGMSCVAAGGFGGGGGGTFRCAYPEGGDTGGMMGSGTVQAFGECAGSDECADGLACTARRGGAGFCTQECQDDAECTNTPGSGTVAAACNFGGLCTLDCADDDTGCPTGMTCQMLGGGGGGMTFSFCNY